MKACDSCSGRAEIGKNHQTSPCSAKSDRSGFCLPADTDTYPLCFLAPISLTITYA